MKLDLRPRLPKDLEPRCKHPTVSSLEIWSELNTSELICDLLQATTKHKNHSQDYTSALCLCGVAYNQFPPGAFRKSCTVDSVTVPYMKDHMQECRWSNRL